MVHSFVYEALPARVIFATLSAALLTEEMARIGMKRPIVLATPLQEPQAREIAAMLDEKSVGVFAGAVMHTPVEITEKALSIVREAKADGVVAIGGGSTTGLSKAIALRTDLPQLVIPTTYAGSEMTPILGETANGVKRTQTTRKVLPETVIYDVELTLGLPPALSAASGLNAIAHAVEAMYDRDRNPIVSMMAEEGIRSLFAALPLIVKKPSDLAARSDALYGAWLCGVCLGSVGMALHRSAVAGQPLPLADLGLPVAVAKGSRVDLALQIPGLSLEAVGLALEAGAVGDHIHVLNPASHAVVEAEVVGPGRARVMPGSLPQPVASQQAALP